MSEHKWLEDLEWKTEGPFSFAEYEAGVKRTMNMEPEKCLRMLNWALSYCEEAGEAASLLKKWRFHGHKLDKEELAKELGDGLYYITAQATEIGMSLEDIAKLNNRKLSKRFKDGFSKEDSINREV